NEAQCSLADVYNMSPYKITWKGQREFLLMPFLSRIAVGFQHVWSESEDCLPFLQLAQDYISSCGKKTLHEILEKVFKSFRPLLGLPDVDDDAFEEYNADAEEEEPEADHQQMGVTKCCFRTNQLKNSHCLSHFCMKTNFKLCCF
uniref:Maturin n=1 Tax=Buteo japonicus TaxID=224669 RepID=A0A8C0AWA0_9AVES